ncbi:MAG: serine hydrolase domain-containing protein [Chloroflexota bacterium]
MIIPGPAAAGVAGRPIAPPERPRRRNPDLAGIGMPAREAIDAGTLPCAVIGVSDAWGTLHLQALAGPADTPSVDSRFFLASVTKPIVATAVMQLVDEGRLGLHEPLVGLIPELKGVTWRERISAWHVLTHTAGLSDLPPKELARQRPSYDRMLAKVCAEIPSWEPGTRFRYCSDSFYLLAEAISRLTGMPFPVALRRRVLDPLGMDATTFDVRPDRANALPVKGVPMGNIVVRELILRFLASAALPGGGLFGTAEDLLRFGRAMLPRRGQDGPRIVSQARIDEMLREQTQGIPETREDGTIRDPHYALGWRKRSDRSSGRLDDGFDAALVIPASPSTATHGGASGTRLWVDPERDLVFVFLSNVWYGDDAPSHAVLRRIYAAWDADGA